MPQVTAYLSVLVMITILLTFKYHPETPVQARMLRPVLSGLHGISKPQGWPKEAENRVVSIGGSSRSEADHSCLLGST